MSNEQLQQWITSIFFGVFVGILTYLSRRKRPNLPPGPVGLPGLGYLPFLGKQAYLTLHTLTLKYGPVFSFYLGNKLVVVLGNYNAVREFLSRKEVLDRPEHPPNHLLPDSTSMTVTNGAVWKEQRRFSFQLLRQLGVGKSRMEEIIMNEIKLMLKTLESQQGKPINFDEIILPSISNNIYTLLTGHRLDVNSKDRLFLNSVLKTMTMYFKPTIVHAYFPWLRPWMSMLKIWGYHQVEALMRQFGKFVMKHVATENVLAIERQDIKSYVEGYLFKMLSHRKTDSTFSERMLVGNFLSIFGAGSTPSRATLEWAFVCFLRYPEIQEKIQSEVDMVIGTSRLPSWGDHVNMPFTMSVIMEVMRSNTTIPISMLRCTSADTSINGYFIPKSTIVLTNLWGVHHHPDDWIDPHDFRPERFMKEGKVVKPVAFIPFSYGFEVSKESRSISFKNSMFAFLCHG